MYDISSLRVNSEEPPQRNSKHPTFSYYIPTTTDFQNDYKNTQDALPI